MEQNIEPNIKEYKRANQDLLSRLENYCGADYVPMHMPGAKRNTQLFQMKNPYEMDITEIDGFDNLHHATDIIAESMKTAAELFGAEETLYLINGSSAGLLSAICGATNRGNRILVARNCHISVYNAIYMNGLEPIYIQPAYDERTGIYAGVTLEEIKKFFQSKAHMIVNEQENMQADYNRKAYSQEQIKAVVITSPTYEGNVSQVREIAEFLHERGVIFIVDEAHGAHFHMADAFPESAVTQGADAVIQSIHKTLPALTQTALLHLNGTLIDRARVKMYWNMYQTTSPSYVLMGSIDRCMSILSDQGQRLFQEYVDRLQKLRGRLEKLENVELFKTNDISKIVLVVNKAGINGQQLQAQLLNNYHIQLEMASLHYVIAMTSIGDTDEYYERFAAALEEIDRNLKEEMDNQSLREEIEEEKDDKNLREEIEEEKDDNNLREEIEYENKGEAALETNMVMIPADAGERLYEQGGELVQLEQAVGKISGTQICIYPPGIPLVNLGERITKEIIETLNIGISTGLEVMGLREGKLICLK